jgi:hypothetical protein
MRNLLTALVLFFSASSANAKCFQYDITGFWQSYSFNSYGEVYECKFFLNGAGNVNTNVSSCFIVTTSNSSGTLPVTAGKITISTACALSGYFDINGTRNTIRKASMGTSMDYATGIVTFNSGGFGTSIFNLVRDQN